MTRCFSNETLVNLLKDYRIITTDAVAKVMFATDRGKYAPRYPYFDEPQSIGYGFCISSPHMDAVALEYLKDYLQPGSKVLDIGCGGGYLPACFLRYINALGDSPETKVIGVCLHPNLVKPCKSNLNADDESFLKSDKLFILKADGTENFFKYGPFNAIHVGVGLTEVPTFLIDHLAKGGRLLVPVGSAGEQFLQQYDKDLDGKVTNVRLLAVSYSPLINLNLNHGRAESPSKEYEVE